jgi:hypothetical protein
MHSTGMRKVRPFGHGVRQPARDLRARTTSTIPTTMKTAPATAQRMSSTMKLPPRSRPRPWPIQIAPTATRTKPTIGCVRYTGDLPGGILAR